jgi:DNA polymerase/3'-5' exonuclease PolX
MTYTLTTAESYAKQVHDAIGAYCLRHETVGSTRRKKPNDIKDVELVCLPDPQRLSELKAIVNSKWGTPKSGPFPSKYTQIRSLVNLDLFWASRETFGLVMFIRTGPRGYVARALGHWKKITNGGYSDEAILWKPDGNGGFVSHPTLTEESVFAALNAPFVPPEHRYETLEEQKRYQQRIRRDTGKNQARHREG